MPQAQLCVVLGPEWQGDEAEQGWLRVGRAQGPPCHKSCCSALGRKGQTLGQPTCAGGGNAGVALAPLLARPAAFLGGGGWLDSQSQPATKGSFLPQVGPWELMHSLIS